eukprot:442226-Pyramimonas_sp.AAC.1
MATALPLHWYNTITGWARYSSTTNTVLGQHCWSATATVLCYDYCSATTTALQCLTTTIVRGATLEYSCYSTVVPSLQATADYHSNEH